MSNHNYSQYSKKNESLVTETPEVKMEIPEAKVEPAIDTTPAVVETLTKPDNTPNKGVETVTGVVANCARLNVRARADLAAAALCVLDAASEVVIDVDKSTPEWFKVHTTAGVDGYCMRKFIDANL